jgi:type IV secretory pathway TrbD component
VSGQLTSQPVPDERAGGEGERIEPTAHPVHTSLVRPIHYLGVERLVISLEVTLCLALVFGLGPGFVTFGICALVVLVMHPTMVWLTARDAMTTEIYMRSRAYADFYAPHAAPRRAARAPRPSIPRAR